MAFIKALFSQIVAIFTPYCKVRTIDNRPGVASKDKVVDKPAIYQRVNGTVAAMFSPTSVIMNEKLRKSPTLIREVGVKREELNLEDFPNNVCISEGDTNDTVNLSYYCMTESDRNKLYKRIEHNGDKNKLRKYVSRLDSAAEFVMVELNRGRWAVVRWDGTREEMCSLSINRVQVHSNACEGGQAYVSCELLSKAYGRKVLPGERFAKGSAELGKGFDKFMITAMPREALKEYADQDGCPDVVVYEKSKGKFLEINHKFMSGGHKAVTGKVMYADLAFVQMSKAFNKYITEYYENDKEALMEDIGSLVADPNYLQNATALDYADEMLPDHKIESTAAFMEQFVEAKGLALSGTVPSALLAGNVPPLVPTTTYRFCMWMENIQKATQKFHVRVPFGIRAYVCCYDPLLGRIGVEEPEEGEISVQTLEGGIVISVVCEKDWVKLCQMSGGADQDDSWGLFIFEDHDGSLVIFAGRQPYAPGDGMFFRLRQEWKDVCNIWMEIGPVAVLDDFRTIVSAVRKLAKDADKLLKQCRTELPDTFIPYTVNKDARHSRAAFKQQTTGLLSILKGMKAGKSNKAEEAANNRWTVTIGPMTNVTTVVANHLLENGVENLSTVEKAYLANLYKHQLYEYVVDQIDGNVDQEMLGLASALYGMAIKVINSVDEALIYRLPMIQVEGRQFGWKKLGVKPDLKSEPEWPDKFELPEETKEKVRAVWANEDYRYHSKKEHLYRLDHDGMVALLEALGFSVVRGSVSAFRTAIVDVFNKVKLQSFMIAGNYQLRFADDALGIMNIDSHNNDKILERYLDSTPAVLVPIVASILSIWSNMNMEFEDKHRWIATKIKSCVKTEKEVILLYQALVMASVLGIRVNKQALDAGRIEHCLRSRFVQWFDGLNSANTAVMQLVEYEAGNLVVEELSDMAKSMMENNFAFFSVGDNQYAPEKYLLKSGYLETPKGSKDTTAPKDKPRRNDDWLILDRPGEYWSQCAWNLLLRQMAGIKAGGE